MNRTISIENTISWFSEALIQLQVISGKLSRRCPHTYAAHPESNMRVTQWKKGQSTGVTQRPCPHPDASTELRWTRRIHVPGPPLHQPAWPATWRAGGGPISRWVPSKGQPVRRWNHSIMDETCLEKRGRHGNAPAACSVCWCWRLWLISW